MQAYHGVTAVSLSFFFTLSFNLVLFVDDGELSSTFAKQKSPCCLVLGWNVSCAIWRERPGRGIETLESLWF